MQNPLLAHTAQDAGSGLEAVSGEGKPTLPGRPGCSGLSSFSKTSEVQPEVDSSTEVEIKWPQRTGRPLDGSFPTISSLAGEETDLRQGISSGHSLSEQASRYPTLHCKRKEEAYLGLCVHHTCPGRSHCHMLPAVSSLTPPSPTTATMLAALLSVYLPYIQVGSHYTGHILRG